MNATGLSALPARDSMVVLAVLADFKRRINRVMKKTQLYSLPEGSECLWAGV